MYDRVMSFPWRKSNPLVDSVCKRIVHSNKCVIGCMAYDEIENYCRLIKIYLALE